MIFVLIHQLFEHSREIVFALSFNYVADFMVDLNSALLFVDPLLIVEVHVADGLHRSFTH